jgi:hypothetical protein
VIDGAFFFPTANSYLRKCPAIHRSTSNRCNSAVLSVFTESVGEIVTKFIRVET